MNADSRKFSGLIIELIILNRILLDRGLKLRLSYLLGITRLAQSLA